MIFLMRIVIVSAVSAVLLVAEVEEAAHEVGVGFDHLLAEERGVSLPVAETTPATLHLDTCQH